MTAEHIKVTPDSERDLVVIEVDRAGFELLERFLSRVLVKSHSAGVSG